MSASLVGSEMCIRDRYFSCGRTDFYASGWGHLWIGSPQALRIQAHQKDEWRIESDRVYYDPRSDWPKFFLWEVWYAAHKVGKRRGIICNYADAEYFMPVINCVSSEVKIIAVKHSLTGAESLNTSTSRFGVSRSTLQKWLLNRNLMPQ